MLEEAQAKYKLIDKRREGQPLRIKFKGALRPGQQEAVDSLAKHENGILSAPTGFGKTVVAAALIAKRGLPTLVIVPKTALVSQWADKLEGFLSIGHPGKPALTPSGKPSKRKRRVIGQIGGRKNRVTGIVDIATFQSLTTKDPSTGEPAAKELVRDYGLVICDECHHAAAPQLELILKATPAKYVHGLSATPKRADGLDRALFMLCGPIRCRVDPKEQARQQGFRRILRTRFTGMRLAGYEPSQSFNQILDGLCKREGRNELIARDIAEALQAGRRALVLTKRKEHARVLGELIGKAAGMEAHVLVSEGTARQRREKLGCALEAIAGGPAVIVATESYLGEGFDASGLDALFLATPISWDGNVTQQVGRLHRVSEGKADVIVTDYVDVSVPMLERMYKKRLKTYARLGYEVEANDEVSNEDDNARFVLRDEAAQALIADIAHAKTAISITAPYASPKAIGPLLEALAGATRRGVEVACALPKDPGGDIKAAFAAARVPLKVDANARAGLAIFDRELVWYGPPPPRLPPQRRLRPPLQKPRGGTRADGEAGCGGAGKHRCPVIAYLARDGLDQNRKLPKQERHLLHLAHVRCAPRGVGRARRCGRAGIVESEAELEIAARGGARTVPEHEDMAMRKISNAIVLAITTVVLSFAICPAVATADSMTETAASDANAIALASETPASEATYAHEDSVTSGTLTVTVQWNDPVLGEPTTFHVSATGGSGSYKYYMAAPAYASTGESYYSSVPDPSRGEYTTYSDVCESKDFTFTMTASGTYFYKFYVMDMGEKPYKTLNTRTYVAMSDDAHPSVTSIVNSAVAQARSATDGSEYAMALYLHDWLLDQLEYDDSLTWASAEAALTRHTGTCQAYTNAYIKLLNAAGIENAETRDTYDGHTWNAVKLDGEWYQVDCTWDDNDDTQYYGFDARHLYFAITDELMAVAHKGHANIYTADGYATCSTSLADNYYVRSGLASQWADAYAERIQTQLNAKATSFSITSDNAYNPPSIIGIQNAVVAYAMDQKGWTTSDGTKVELTATSSVTTESSTTWTAEYEFEAAYPTTAINISAANVTANNQTYTGLPINPSVTVMLGGKTLAYNMDYTVTYSNNVNAGIGKVTVIGKGNYTGYKTANFTIGPASLTAAIVSATAQVYTGSALTPSPTVRLGNKTLTKGGDYTVSYSNNTNAGTGAITIIGKGNYTGYTGCEFAIEAIDASKAKIVIAEQAWTGKYLTPPPTVTLNGKTLKQETDYTASYINNINVGAATVSVTFKNYYRGKASAKFAIKETFRDVNASTAHAENIVWLASAGISSGWIEKDGSKSFRPYTDVARCDMAAFLYRLAGSPIYTAPSKSPFIDVNKSTPHYKEICWLADGGISTGWTTSSGKEFRPYKTIARCDMAAFLYRLASSPGYTVPLATPFKDCNTKTPHYKEVCWLVNAGISDGWKVANGKEFRPYNNVTRADMAAFLQRMRSNRLVKSRHQQHN